MMLQDAALVWAAANFMHQDHPLVTAMKAQVWHQLDRLGCVHSLRGGSLGAGSVAGDQTSGPWAVALRCFLVTEATLKHCIDTAAAVGVGAGCSWLWHAGACKKYQARLAAGCSGGIGECSALCCIPLANLPA